jgi:hypothetical protein
MLAEWRWVGLRVVAMPPRATYPAIAGTRTAASRVMVRYREANKGKRNEEETSDNIEPPFTLSSNVRLEPDHPAVIRRMLAPTLDANLGNLDKR